MPGFTEGTRQAIRLWPDLEGPLIAAAGHFLPVPISHAQSPVHSCLSSLILPFGLRPLGSVDSKGRWLAQASKLLEVIDMQEIAVQEESCVQCSIEELGGDLA